MSRFIDAIDYIIDLCGLIGAGVVVFIVAFIIAVIIMMFVMCIWTLCFGDIQGTGRTVLEVIGFIFGFIFAVRVLVKISD